MTPEDYGEWTGRTLTPAEVGRITRYLAASEALIRRIAAPAELPEELPVDLEAIQVDMVTRAVTIPAGKTREDLGDYSWTGGGGIIATDDEVDVIRDIAGLNRITAIELKGVLPQSFYNDFLGGFGNVDSV